MEGEGEGEVVMKRVLGWERDAIGFGLQFWGGGSGFEAWFLV